MRSMAVLIANISYLELTLFSFINGKKGVLTGTVLWFLMSNFWQIGLPKLIITFLNVMPASEQNLVWIIKIKAQTKIVLLKDLPFSFTILAL